MPPSRAEPWIDWGKALASQLIVWHHLVHYGPLAARARQAMPLVADWLDQRALLAVQVFLVMAGYLAARSLWPQPGQTGLTLADWPRRVAQRWQRLMPLYVAALVLALLCAALARQWMTDPDTPVAPTLAQVLAHLVLLQDVLGQPALSAGVWYVAIDFQLFALLAALAGVAAVWRQPAADAGDSPSALSVAASAGSIAAHWRVAASVALLALVALASIVLFNRAPGGDTWATYFLGAYGLGVLAAWGTRDGQRARWCVLILALAGIGLWLHWRDRLALALIVALVLLWQPGRQWLASARLSRAVAWLASVSYALFLVHYPVSLLVNAAFDRWWPQGAWLGVLGLGIAWLASLGVAWLLWQGLERHAWRRWLHLPGADAPALKT
jgi:peptidoglycan/LPS O-acetylase OafA/YrhL